MWKPKECAEQDKTFEKRVFVANILLCLSHIIYWNTCECAGAIQTAIYTIVYIRNICIISYKKCMSVYNNIFSVMCVRISSCFFIPASCDVDLCQTYAQTHRDFCHNVKFVYLHFFFHFPANKLREKYADAIFLFFREFEHIQMWELAYIKN